MGVQVGGGHGKVPLLGAIGAHVGGLEVVPLLGAIARCHVVRRHGKVPLLGVRGWVYRLADWTWCRCIARCHVVRCHGKVPLLGAIGWVRTLADWTWGPCWVPLLGAMWLRCESKVPLDRVPFQGAIAETHFDRRTWCHCWVPWQGAVAGCHVVRCHSWVLGAI